MNYEEKYKQALLRAKEFMTNKGVAPNADAFKTAKELTETIFPELKESEDERMRNAAINACKYMVDNFENSTKQYEDAIAWLEKQGEKPVERDTEIHDLWVYIREWNDKFGRLPVDEDELEACIDYVMKRQKPADKIEQKPAWSEEDEYVYNEILKRVADKKLYEHDLEYIYTWLKSIKSNHWKPSEEQMKALIKRTQGLHTNSETRKVLESLIFDLQEKL